VTGRASNQKISASIIPHEKCTTFPLIFFLYCCPFSCLRRAWWDGVEEDAWIGEGELRGNGSPRRAAIKPVCMWLYLFSTVYGLLYPEQL